MLPLSGGDSKWTSGAVVGGAYRLGERIGEGGFGSVFRATHIASQTDAAIKILSREAMGRDDGVARFQREAELAMRLTHESTIRVLASGDAGDGTPFIAFELLEGTSLDVLLQAGALSRGKALTVANALLGSLAEAHRLGIVHRDLKPANVFVCTKPDGLVKLLDFGVAKSTVPTNDVGLTRDGLMVGTPAYMAPEQINGKGLGPETDLYAVALVLGEMLSGKPVYDAAALQICMDKLRGILPAIDPRIATAPFFRVMERALKTDPHDRYKTADEMRLDLASTGVIPEPLGNVRASRSSGTVSAKGTEIMDAPRSNDAVQQSQGQFGQAPYGRGSAPSDPRSSDATSDPGLPFKDTLGIPTPPHGGMPHGGRPHGGRPHGASPAEPNSAYGATLDLRPLSSQPGPWPAQSHEPPPGEPRWAPQARPPSGPKANQTLAWVVGGLVLMIVLALLLALNHRAGNRMRRGAVDGPSPPSRSALLHRMQTAL